MSAWLTSAGCVQMIACPPFGTTVWRCIHQRDGQAVPGGAGRHDLILSALHDQDGTAIPATSARESSATRPHSPGDAAADTWIATWKLFC